MDVHIESLETTVRAVDDRTLLSPDVMDAVVREVLTRLDARQAGAERAGDERAMWRSVRSER
jgi:hypothetical protein